MSYPRPGKTQPSRADSDILEADTVEQLMIDAQSYDEVRHRLIPWHQPSCPQDSAFHCNDKSVIPFVS